MPIISQDALKVYRGTEASIKSFTISNGGVYFATDTNKIFFDAFDKRRVMSGEGVSFVYGSHPNPVENIETGLYSLLISNILSSSVSVDDIIINSDNGFYKVVEVLADSVLCQLMVIAGSGGGGTGTGRRLSIKKTSDWPLTVAAGYSVVGTFTVTSNLPEDTAAVVTITISAPERLNDIVRSYEVVVNEPYTITLPAGDFLKGNNTIKAQAAIDADKSSQISKTINVISIGFFASSSWNPLKKFGADFNGVEFGYRLEGLPVDGSIPATITYYIDDLWVDEQTNIRTESSFLILTDKFKDFSHGDHQLRISASILINGQIVKIGELSYNIMWIIRGETAPIIISPYTKTEEINYSIIHLPYMVYDPLANEDVAEVHYYVNNEEVSTGAKFVTYSHQAYDDWEINNYVARQVNAFAITCGITTKTFQVEIVVDSNRNLDPISEQCYLYLSSFGRSNDESTLRRSTWDYTNASGINTQATFSGFNWYNNGWIRDEENHMALRLSNGANISIPLNLLNTKDGRDLTFEIDFKMRNVTGYEKLVNIIMVPDPSGVIDPETGEVKMIPKKIASNERNVVGQYYNNSIGLCIGTQETYFSSQNSLVNVAYPDEQRVKVSVVLNIKEQLIYIYINSILTGIQKFSNDSFDANVPAFTFNSNYCDVDIYTIRVYTTALNYMQIIQNWYGDAPDLNAKLARYDRNNISTYDAKNNATIDYIKAKDSGLIPVMVISTLGQDITNNPISDMLPYQKGLKKVVKVRYYDPFNPKNNFHCQNASLDVQGTSSQGYPRRNYKLKTKIADKNITTKLPFKFQDWDGREITKDLWTGKDMTKYNLGHGIPETSFCLKADYMESSSSHNTGLANYVDRLSTKLSDTYDLRHPLVRENIMESCRTTIYGFPILLFHENAAGEIIFVGKYNFNIDKGATNSFGFTNGSLQPFMSKTVTAPETQKFAFRVDELSADKPLDGFYPQLQAIPAMAALLTSFTTQTGYSTDKSVVKPVKFKSNVGLTKFAAAVNNVEGLYSFTWSGTGWNLNKHDVPAAAWGTTQLTGGTSVATNLSKATLETTYGMQFEIYVEANLTNTVQFWYYLTPSITLNVIRGQSTTFEEAAECWEFKNNQAGRSTFQKVDFEETDAEGKLALLSDFEQRYHFSDFDTDAIYEAHGEDKAAANAEILGYMGNFKKLCEWVNSTDTSSTRPPVQALLKEAYYKTLDSEWDRNRQYYQLTNGTYTLFEVTESSQVTTDAATTLVNSTVFIEKIKLYYGLTQLSDIVGEYTFTFENGKWIFNSTAINLVDFGISFTSTQPNKIVIDLAIKNTWNGNLYEKFVNDDNRYRLCKFKSEFTDHFNKPYCLFYAILTEFLLMYDSRAKNVMLASWGLEAVGGEYIWYPIFYDMDTQLGINNSGIVYWDYDTNATPDDGSASIFSGTASLLWNNISTCFASDIKVMYRLMRKSSFNYAELVNYYDTKQTDKWSEIMKNIDAFYKYIAPSIPSIGYTTIDGTISTTDTFFYCLQGDRQLNRDLFFRNRLNYMDSKWQGGSYQSDGTQGGSSIQMRYNANDAANTSDSGVMEVKTLDANATYDITPYLSQYCMLFYDERVTKPLRFDTKVDEKVTIFPPASLKQKIEGGSPLTQQLVYVYGPGYIADLGDLSLKYLNEFFGQNALKIQHLKVGNENPNYRNIGLTDTNFKLDSAATVPDGDKKVANPNAKTLLSTLDISNLTRLSEGLDLSGCTKLKVLKSLGTNLQSITLPDGNIIETLYLPSTITSLKLIEPQALTAIIEDGAQANYLRNDKGLYIQTLTDELNEATIATATTRINTYAIENTMLKYDTYRILNKLFDIKVAMQNNANLDVVYSPILRLSLRGVDWTPYHLLEDDAKYDAAKALKYYLRRPNMTYERYVYDANTWVTTLKNIGVYEKDDKDSIIDNLSIVDTFLTQKLDNSIDLYHQYFRSTYEDGLKKQLVPITGNLHINNASTAPLDEAELLNYYNLNYPELTITANFVTESYRAHFIEVDENNKPVTKGWQKISKSATTKPIVAYKGVNPNRIHYDFLGWSTNSALLQTQSIGTKEDVVDLTTLTLNQNYTFYAVFSIHSYSVYLKNADGLENIATVLVPSGQTVQLPTIVPYNPLESTLDLTQCYKFIGYGYKDDNKVIDFSKLKIFKEGLTFYAKYIQDTIYNNPIKEEYLSINTNSNGEITICLKPGVKVKGKICFPSTVTYGGAVRDVGSIAGISQTESLNVGYNSDTGLSTLGSNGLAGNDQITHIFFQGTGDNTCKLNSLAPYCFCAMRYLSHIEFPPSLTTVGMGVMRTCRRLSLSNLKNITMIDSNAFSDVNVICENPNLQISGKVTYIGNYAFTQSGWTNITIGSTQNPCNNLSGNLSDNVIRFGGPTYGENWDPQAKELNTFTIYSSVITSASNIAGSFREGANGLMNVTFNFLV